MRITGRRYHLLYTPSLLFVAVSGMLGLGAINAQNNLLFVLFGVALGALLVSGVLSGSMMMRIRATRDTPHTGQVGAPLRIRYRLKKTGRLPAFAITTRERPPKSSSAANLIITSHCPTIPGRGETTIFATLTPTARGPLTLDRLDLRTTFPLGISLKSVAFAKPQTILIQPRVPLLRPDTLTLAGLSRRGAQERPNIRGMGNEFFGLRPLAADETATKIAWRASARRGQLLVREHTATGQRAILLNLLLDPWDDQDAAERNERAIVLAAGLAALALAQGQRIGIVGPTLDLPPSASRSQLPTILDALARIPTTDHHPPHRTAPTSPAVAVLTVAAAPGHPLSADRLNELELTPAFAPGGTP